MDCSSIAGEYKHALESFFNDATHIGRNTKNDEISYEDKTYWESQLDALQRASNYELEKLNKLASSHPAFTEYARLVSEQKTISNEINSNKNNLDRIKSSIEQVVNKIAQISSAYAQARKWINDGDYSPAAKLLSQARFDAIIEQAMREVT
jgi:hypothetical protein